MAKRIRPQHIIIGSFLGAILVGTLLLSLPIAAQEGDKVVLIDRIFTATSAVCVTGLVVKDTAAWSPFGRFIIMLLFQAGGLGIMTYSTLFGLLLRRRMTISQNLVVEGTLGHYGIRGLKSIIFCIVFIVFFFEATGAALLFLRWRAIYDWPLGTTLYNAVFHSISAFCNAGFSLFDKSFTGFKGDLPVNLIMMGLIIIGGMGFVVILDLWSLASRRADKRPRLSRMSIQTKAVLVLTAALILGGACLIYSLENGNVLAGAETRTKVLSSFFQAVTARTAGFNTLPIAKLAAPTLLVLIFLMFIGASPGSTGGGIKTCTFGVVIASTISMIKNKERVWLFKKTLTRGVIRRALAIFILALGWIFLFSLLLSITERGNVLGDNYYLRILFETTSAFGTVGLSTGITPMLGTIGKILLVMTMFAGRIGPLTLALAVALQEEKLLYNYPEERIMVG